MKKRDRYDGKRYQIVDGKYVDCSFRVGRAGEGRKIIYTDSKPLIEKSRGFKIILYTNGIDVYKPIDVCNIQPRIFLLLIWFLNTEDSTLDGQTFSWSDLIALKLAAEQFEIQDLVQLCVNRVKWELDFGSIWDALEASVKCEDIRLICEKFLASNTRDSLNHPNFLKINETVLGHFLSLDPLDINSELDLVNSCIKLAKAKGEQESHFMNVAIPHLRLLTLSSMNFGSICLYLSPEEDMAIMEYQHSRILPKNTLERICKITVERKKPATMGSKN